MALTLTQVEQLYVGYFGRAGDTAGVQYWIANGGVGSFGFAQVAASFSVQPEAVAKYPFLAAPNIANVGSFIDQVYVNLFGHVADAAGKAFWTTQLNASLGNPQAVGQFIVNVISGAQGTDLTAINAKVYH
jgi:endoglucanase